MADFTQEKKYNYNWQNSKFKDIAVSGSKISQFINDAGYVTSSVAISASYALTASYADKAVSASYFSGSISNAVNAISASYALTASYAISASYEINYETSSSYADFAVSASHALTASFITASGVYGPYGSNSVISASFALTASSALNAQDILIKVLNQSGNPIAKGVVVHITASGNSSDIPRVITASYENDNNSANTLGITNETIANGAEGFIMTEGVLKGINTSAFVSGQLIYLGATGSIIGTAPVAPLHAVRLGQVIREQLNNGSIYVRIDNGYELGELHDVRDTTTSSSYGDLLVKSGSIWINSKQLTGSYGLTGSLTTVGSQILTGSLQVQNSIDSSLRFLFDSLGTSSLDWEDGYLYNGSGSISVDWKDRKLYDANVDNSINWDTRQLIKSDGTTVTLNWETGAFTGSMFGTASYATQALSSSFTTTSSYAVNAGNTNTIDVNSFGSNVESYLLMSNVIATSGVAIGGDTDLRYNASTNRLTVGSVSATNLTGSLLGTSSYASQALSSSYALNATNATTASYVLNAVSASYATQALSSSFATTSSFVTTAQTASYVLQAVSASFASTASSVNTLNQNVLISGSLTVGATSSGANENTLILGPKGTQEGGQLLLQAGTSYTSASMLDMYQDSTNPYFRLLRGSNAGSDAVVAQWNMHTKQMFLPAYNSPTAFTGTTLVGLLGFDSNGALITTTTGSGGGGGGVTITNNVDNYVITATGTANTLNGESNMQFNGSSLSVTGEITSSGAIRSTANNAMYLRGGDDAEFWDINVANTVGIYGQQDQTVAGLKLGSSGATLHGSGSRFGIATTSPVATLDVNGNLYVASGITGSLLGTATTASYVLQAVSSSFASTASFTPNALTTASVSSNTITFTKGDGTTFPITVDTGSGGSTFPYTGSAIISGSLEITGSFSVNNGTALKIDTITSTLTDDGNISSIDWQNRYLNDQNNLQSLNWGDRRVFDSNTSMSADWRIRTLFDNSETISTDWINRQLFDSNASMSADWRNRQLFDSNTSRSADWRTRNLFDTNESSSIIWNTRQLNNQFGNKVLDWQNAVVITGSLIVTGSQVITGSVNSRLTVNNNLGFRQAETASYNLGTQSVGGTYRAVNFTGSVVHTTHNGSTDSRIGVSAGNSAIPSIGATIPSEIVGFTSETGSNYSSVFAQRIDTTAIGGGPTLQAGLLSIFNNNEQYDVRTDSSNKSLSIRKFDTAGKSIQLTLQGSETGFNLSNNLTSTSASLFKINNSSSNIIFETFQTGLTQINGSLIVTGSTAGIDTILASLKYNNDIVVDWGARVLYNDSLFPVFNWQSGVLNDNANTLSLDLVNRQMFTSANGISIDYENRRLYNSAGSTILDWENGSLSGNATTATTATSASFASTASFVNPLNQQVVITGSLRGNVSTLSISSNTASLDMRNNNFFTLNLVNGADTHINPTNLQPGQTVNIRVNQGSLGTGTVSFPSFVDQPSGSAYTGSQVANAIDIVTMITFDSSLVFVSSVRNMI